MGKRALSFAVADLKIPEHFSGIFTQEDYHNAQKAIGQDQQVTPSIWLTPTAFVSSMMPINGQSESLKWEKLDSFSVFVSSLRSSKCFLSA